MSFVALFVARLGRLARENCFISYITLPSAVYYYFLSLSALSVSMLSINVSKNLIIDKLTCLFNNRCIEMYIPKFLFYLLLMCIFMLMFALHRVQGRDRSEANEQRLPLKKRHRHISTAVPTDHTQSLTTAFPAHELSIVSATMPCLPPSNMPCPAPPGHASPPPLVATHCSPFKTLHTPATTAPNLAASDSVVLPSYAKLALGTFHESDNEDPGSGHPISVHKRTSPLPTPDSRKAPISGASTPPPPPTTSAADTAHCAALSSEEMRSSSLAFRVPTQSICSSSSCDVAISDISLSPAAARPSIPDTAPLSRTSCTLVSVSQARLSSATNAPSVGSVSALLSQAACGAPLLHAITKSNSVTALNESLPILNTSLSNVVKSNNPSSVPTKISNLISLPNEPIVKIDNKYVCNGAGVNSLLPLQVAQMGSVCTHEDKFSPRNVSCNTLSSCSNVNSQSIDIHFQSTDITNDCNDVGSSKNLQRLHSLALTNSIEPIRNPTSQYHKEQTLKLESFDPVKNIDVADCNEPYQRKQLQKFTIMNTPYINAAADQLYSSTEGTTTVTSNMRQETQTHKCYDAPEDSTSVVDTPVTNISNTVTIEPYTSNPNRASDQVHHSSTTPKKRHRFEAEMKTIARESVPATPPPCNVERQDLLPNSEVVTPNALIGVQLELSVLTEKSELILMEDKKPIVVNDKPKYDKPHKNKESQLPKERIKLYRSAKIDSNKSSRSPTCENYPPRVTRAMEILQEQKVITRQQSKSPSISPTSSPIKRRCESRTSTMSTRSRETLSKPGTPDLIADTDVSPDKMAQDIIITDGILNAAKDKIDLLSCKVDLYQMNNELLLNRPSVGCSPTKFGQTLEKVCGSHSDSDIASEHEPLNESDQSGFMSDKEEELVKTPIVPPQKRLKKKRELRTPAQKVLKTEKVVRETAEICDDNKDLPPPPPAKKKSKKRRPNRTGFPTIKKKKKITKLEVEEEHSTMNKIENNAEQNVYSCKLSIAPDITPSLNTSTTIDCTNLHTTTEKECTQRFRGRPKKIKPQLLSPIDPQSDKCDDKLREGKLEYKEIANNLPDSACETESLTCATPEPTMDGREDDNGETEVSLEGNANLTIGLEETSECIDDTPLDGVSSRTRRKRDLLTQPCDNPAAKRRRRLHVIQEVRRIGPVVLH